MKKKFVSHTRASHCKKVKRNTSFRKRGIIRSTPKENFHIMAKGEKKGPALDSGKKRDLLSREGEKRLINGGNNDRFRKSLLTRKRKDNDSLKSIDKGGGEKTRRSQGKSGVVRLVPYFFSKRAPCPFISKEGGGKLSVR